MHCKPDIIPFPLFPSFLPDYLQTISKLLLTCMKLFRQLDYEVSEGCMI